MLAYVFDKGLVVVTKNSVDFLRLAQTAALHAGMLLIRAGALLVDVEWRWIEPVLSHLRNEAIDPINLVFEVTGPAAFKVRSIPPLEK